MKMSKSTIAAVALVVGVVVGGGLIRLNSRMASPEEQGNEAATVTPPKAEAVVGTAKSGSADSPPQESYEEMKKRLQSLVGIIPYQSEELLQSIGATTEEAQIRVNALVEETFLMIVESVAKFGKFARSDNTIRVEGIIPDGTREMIRARFYRRLAAEVGEVGMERFVGARAEQIGNALLGFGENPVTILIERSGASSSGESTVALTFSTTNGRSPSEFFFVSQTLDQRTFAAAFPGLQGLTE